MSIIALGITAHKMSSRWLNSTSYFLFYFNFFFFPQHTGWCIEKVSGIITISHCDLVLIKRKVYFFFFLLVSLWKYLYYKSSRLLERHPKVFYPSTYIPGAHRYLLVRAKKQVLVMPTVIVPISGKVLLPVDKKKTFYTRPCQEGRETFSYR